MAVSAQQIKHVLATLALIAAPIFVHAQVIPTDLNFDALIEQYLQGLAGQLPANQRGQIDVYRKYIYDSVNGIIPPNVLQEQLEAVREIFPETQPVFPGAPPITRSTTDQDLALQTDTPSPTPKEQVTVAANFNVGVGPLAFPDAQKQATTTYNWYLDNVFVPAFSGLGRNTLTFTSGSLGTVHAVRLQARMQGGRVITAAMLMPIVDADIVWFTDTYVPPGYRGKALVTFESPIVAAAQVFVPAEFGLLNYIWTIDGDTPLTGFGLGKNRVLVGFPQQSHAISVHIRDLAGNIDITREILVRRVNPEVILHVARTGRYYTDTSARQTFELAPAGRLSVVALPYFFAVSSPAGLRFRWTFDANTLPESPKNPDVFTLNIAQGALRSGNGVRKSLQILVESKNPKRSESAQLIVPVVI